MTNQAIFRVALGLMFATVIVSRRLFERRAAGQASAGLKQDRDPGRLIFVESLLLTIGNLGIIAHLINPNWMAWSSLELPAWLGWTGLAVAAAGTGSLLWTHAALGENFFGGIKLREGHQLVTNGPYQWVRHPMYTAFLLLSLGWFLLTGNLVVGLGWMGSTLLVLATRLQQEEAMLLDEFGDAYRSYSERTGRLFPRLALGR